MKKKKLYIELAVYIILVLADGVLTWINTPDLKMEGNPLVTRLGLGWGALATSNILAVVFVWLLARYSFLRYESVNLKETSFTAYGSRIMFDRPDRFWTGLIPKHWEPLAAMGGYAFLPAVIFGRALLVTDWLLYTAQSPFHTQWHRFRSLFPFDRPDVILGSVLGVVLGCYWIYREYKKQLPTESAEMAER